MQPFLIKLWRYKEKMNESHMKDLLERIKVIESEIKQIKEKIADGSTSSELQKYLLIAFSAVISWLTTLRNKIT